MKELVKSQAFRETLIFGGLLGAALLISSLFDPSGVFALDSDDSIDFVDDLTGGEGDLKSLLNTILSYFLGFLGFICVIMVIYGGVLYVTSAGNDENVGKAKKILLYAGIGVILIMISFALVSTILGAASTGGGTTGGTTVQ
ncbi:hypothetical protein A3J23_01400 [Candidatus Peregrinibacteria bacterium RIFCSPLOWO2_02_FULL_48_14]|nr:MAG: hypothetical protein A3J23_01400 [Candidatus Peregrinibacteria bacterium RIFCSPLOWO2_02_FULL_48_14]